MNQENLTQALKNLVEQRATQPEPRQSMLTKIRKNLLTLNLYPSSTANDYLKHTSACRSLNKALADDWDQVGRQLLTAYQKAVNSQKG